MKFTVTRDNERLLEILKRLGKVPQNLTHLSGFNMAETVEEDGTPGVSLILGPTNGGMDGRAPQAIPMSLLKSERPHLADGRIYKADVVDDGEGGFKLVRPTKEDVALRVITTGLLYSLRDGSTTKDLMEIGAAGKKLRYHGVFPLTRDAASIVGEGLAEPITAQSRIIVDERFGKIKNLPGVHKLREITIEGVIGGPVLVGQIDGTLKIHELTRDGWKVHDVTDVERWQQKFMDLALQDVDYLAALREAEKKKARRKVKVTKGPPVDHPDA